MVLLSERVVQAPQILSKSPPRLFEGKTEVAPAVAIQPDDKAAADTSCMSAPARSTRCHCGPSPPPQHHARRRCHSIAAAPSSEAARQQIAVVVPASRGPHQPILQSTRSLQRPRHVQHRIRHPSPLNRHPVPLRQRRRPGRRVRKPERPPRRRLREVALAEDPDELLQAGG